MSFLLKSNILNRSLYEINVTKSFVKHNLNLCFCKYFCVSVPAPKPARKKRIKKTDDTVSEIFTNKHKTVFNYLSSSSELKEIIPHVPISCLRICKTAPPCLYMVSKSTAKHLMDLIKDKLNNKCPIVEVNPGFGCLTKTLLDNGVKFLTLYESSAHFDEPIKQLQIQYPNRLDYRKDDFFGLYKLIFKDSFDCGNRFDTLISGLNIDNESNDTSMQILGTMSGPAFLKNLMYSLIFSGGSLGRPQMFVVIPPSAFYTLVPNESGLENNRSSKALQVLFKLLFDYSVLDKLPRQHFLPWQIDLSQNLKKNNFRKETLKMDNEHFLLVQIQFKKKLPCHFDNLSLLWFFLKQYMGSQKIRVIPSLEQWIPGCGIWLITQQDPPDTDKTLAPDENDVPLPHMTIFTLFQDLSAEQILTLFKKFISWPEFKNCPFTEEMENLRVSNMSHSSLDAKYDELFEQEHEDEYEKSDE